MADVKKINPSKLIANNSHADISKYKNLYNQSIVENENFWREQGKIIDWIKPYSKISNFSFDKKMYL